MTFVIDRRLESVQRTVEERIRFLQEDNARKLDGMRQTVDEKLTRRPWKPGWEKAFKAVGRPARRVCTRAWATCSSLAGGGRETSKGC